ncbi:MAG TPA: hydroxymethylbilane synthase [Longimicrobiales bacterium]|nr:hydroxymethylbilane synthase [Longimicrobiales bacterium]
MKLRIASRGSALALWQAEHVKARLEGAHAGLSVSIEVIRTTGDRITDVPLSRIGDKGLFTKEVDAALLDGRAQLAVHSLKDVPTQVSEGLALGAIALREDPRDALVVAPGRPATLMELPAGARVGTSSLRRRSQLLHARRDLAVDDLRGNLDTRLERVAAGEYDAVILAHAGIRRLGRADAVASLLEPPEWLPAVGQGALGIALRADDEETRAAVAVLDHAPSRQATTAERAFLRRLEGGCQVPIGALAEVIDGRLRLQGLVASLDGRTVLRGEREGDPELAEEVGDALAHQLLNEGAGVILERIRSLAPADLPGASPP